jgi:hypothetical protein
VIGQTRGRRDQSRNCDGCCCDCELTHGRLSFIEVCIHAEETEVRVALFPPVTDKFSIQTECQNVPLNMLGFDEIARGKTRIAGRCRSVAPLPLKSVHAAGNQTAAWQLEHSAYGRSRGSGQPETFGSAVIFEAALLPAWLHQVSADRRKRFGSGHREAGLIAKANHWPSGCSQHAMSRSGPVVH